MAPKRKTQQNATGTKTTKRKQQRQIKPNQRVEKTPFTNEGRYGRDVKRFY